MIDFEVVTYLWYYTAWLQLKQTSCTYQCLSTSWIPF